MPALWKAKVGKVRGKPGQHCETLSLLKIQNEKICQAWWQAHVVPATWEPEAGELLNCSGCSEQKPHHCTPAWVTEQDFQKEKKKINWKVLGSHFKC